MNQFDLEILHMSGDLNPIADWMSWSTDSLKDADALIDQVAVPLFSAVPPAARLELPSVQQLRTSYTDMEQADKDCCNKGDDELYYVKRTGKLYIPPHYRNSVMY